MNSEDRQLIELVYGDTDSVGGDTVLRAKDLDGREFEITIENLYNKYKDNSMGVTLKGHESVSCNCKILNWDEKSKLYYGTPKRIIRHRVTKAKWRLKTKSGKEIFVTNDHSMIVFRNGEKIEVKPNNILPGDKILIIKE